MLALIVNINNLSLYKKKEDDQLNMKQMSLIREIAKKRAQEMLAMRPAITQECCKYVCHLFIPTGEDLIKSHGSGVLIKYNEQYYLLTAAHVVDDFDIQHICIPRIGKGEYTILGGKWHRLDPDKNREEDKIDLAFLLLDEDTVSILIEEGYFFLEESLLGLNHTLNTKYPCYLMLGFPASKSKYNKYTNNISEERFAYITKPVSKDNWPDDLDQKRNFCLIRKATGYNQKTNQKCQMPDPRGISGGGLWFIDDYNHSFNLVGIMFEYKIDYYAATKIDLFIKAINDAPNNTTGIIHL